MEQKQRLVKTIRSFLEILETFEYRADSLDHIWVLLYPDEKEKWHKIHVKKYDERFFFGDISGKEEFIEFKEPDSVGEVEGWPNRRYTDFDAWNKLLLAAHTWILQVRKDWVSANKRVQNEFPLSLRKGKAPHAIIRSAFPDVYRIDREIGEERTQKIVSLVESRELMREHIHVDSFTANEFFNYCRIAYIAAEREDESVDVSLTGRQMYERYADGRDNGLLSINGDSPEEFADWIDCKHEHSGMGGHPWEIKRGGNTTHINLAVYRPYSFRSDGFRIELRGESFTRMGETLKMFCALHDEGLPIAISDPEGVRMRLLAQDNIGIIPEYMWYHRANQTYGKSEDVYDVLHYNELGRYKRRITPFITWEPLPILKPA